VRGWFFGCSTAKGELFLYGGLPGIKGFNLDNWNRLLCKIGVEMQGNWLCPAFFPERRDTNKLASMT